MRHIIALFIKIVMVSAVLVVTMNVINPYPFIPTFALSMLLVGLSYLVGDLGILPFTKNNTVATLSDVLLSVLTIWWIGPFFVKTSIPFSVALMSGVLIGVGEWFFHRYFMESLMPRKDAL